MLCSDFILLAPKGDCTDTYLKRQIDKPNNTDPIFVSMPINLKNRLLLQYNFPSGVNSCDYNYFRLGTEVAIVLKMSIPEFLKNWPQRHFLGQGLILLRVTGYRV